MIRRFDGFVVIKPVDVDQPVPLSCGLCDSLMRSREDEEAYSEFSCCHFCAMTWAHPRREAWHAGWRPNKLEAIALARSRPPSRLLLTTE